MPTTTKTKIKKKAEGPVEKKITTSVAERAVTPHKHVRSFQGTVVSAAMHKTIVVRVDHLKRHPKYHKSYRVSNKFHVHDEKGAAKVGDVVDFVECRPLSKTKRWRLISARKNAS